MKGKEEIFIPDWDFDSDSDSNKGNMGERNTVDCNKNNRVVNAYETVKFMVKRIENLYELRKGIERKELMSEVTDDILYDLLHEISYMGMAVRAGIIDNTHKNYRREKLKLYVNALPISVSQPENAIIRIKLPPLVARNYKGAYNVYWDVKNAIEAYRLENEIEPLNNCRVVLIYKKYYKNINSPYSCDNDNWEMKRTTNAIAEGLNYPDNIFNFSFMYTAVKAEENYVEATLIKMENMELFTKYIMES